MGAGVARRALDRRDRLVDGQPVADDGIDDLENRPRDSDRAGAPGDEPRLAMGFEDDRRGHHAREARPGLARPVADHVELAEHVVELEPVLEDTGARAERRGHADRGAVGVDDRDVSRPGRLGAARSADPRAHISRRERGHERPRLRRRAGRVVLSPGERFQARADDPPATRRRRRREDDRLAELALERLARLDGVAHQILREIRQEERDGLGPRLLQEPEGRHQIACIDAAQSAVDPAPARVALEDRGEDLVEVDLRRIGRLYPPGELERRDEEALPGEPPSARLGLDEPGDESRDGDGRLADVEHLGRRPHEVDLDLLHLARVARRHGEEAVQERRRLPRLVEEGEAAAGGTGERALGDEGRERRGDGGVDRRAALAERPGSGIGRVSVSRRDSTAHAGERRTTVRARERDAPRRRRNPPLPHAYDGEASLCATLGACLAHRPMGLQSRSRA